MRNTSLISVIIPVYNAEDTIYSALNSISQQTEGKFEVIVVNDGSTDKSLEAIYAFKKTNSHLNVIVIDKSHEGVSATRNIGLQLASGNYIAFLDADDEWHPEKTLKQLAILKETAEADLVGCHFKPLVAEPALNSFSYITSKEMLFKNFFQTSTVLMKRKVFDAVGFFERSLSYGEERNYFLRASKTFACVLINENLINYGNGKRGFGQSGLSGNLLQMEIGELKNLIYAYKILNMPFFACCNAIVYSLAKFMRRVCIVYIADKFK
ncbi:MAG: glycosyltransferase family 2 protein [Parafilimonas sp.]|nr:glycosyltransferase family 2 protein [Parafilimonas sp.]